jgi:hypothetical protein
MEEPQDTPVEPAPRITEDRPCLRCGYSLRSISRDAVCPECASSVAASLRGELLVNDPGRTARLARGARLAICGFWFGVLGTVALVALAMLPIILDLFFRTFDGHSGDVTDLLFRYGFRALYLGIAVLAGSGWWILTQPEPKSMLTPAIRWSFRCALLAAAAAPLLAYGLGTTPNLFVGLAFVWLVATGFCAFAIGRILQEMGPRLQDYMLWRRGPWMGWVALATTPVIIAVVLGAVLELDERLLVAFTILAGIGCITWMAMYGDLVTRARTLLRRLRAAQDACDAA